MTYLFGTSNPQPTTNTQMANEYTAGIRIVEIDVGWDNAEPSNGVFDNTNINSFGPWITNCTNNSINVVINCATNYPPSWVMSQSNAYFVNQYGVNAPVDQFGKLQANAIFSINIRNKVAAFISQVFTDLGTSFWGIRLSIGAAGEALYPAGPDGSSHTHSYWAFDANAQNNTAADRPTSLPPNPMIGWHPGDTTWSGSSVTTTQVTNWYTWYVTCMADYINFVVSYIRNTIGFTGYIQLCTPGFGARPTEVNAECSNYLNGLNDPNQTVCRGSAWYLLYPMIVNINKLICYVSSLADGSGSPADNLWTSADDAVNLLTDASINSWSASRVLTWIARRQGLSMMGENPGSGDPNRGVPYSLDMVSVTASQMAASGMLGMFLVADANLYAGTSDVTLAGYQAIIASYNNVPLSGLGGVVEAGLLNHFAGVGAYTTPTTMYLALLLGTPTNTMTPVTMVEASYTGYARVLVPLGSLSAASMSSTLAQITSTAPITFAPCTGGGSTIAYWAIVESATGTTGRVLWYGAFSTTYTIVPGVTFTVPSGDLALQLSTTTGLAQYAALKLVALSVGKAAWTMPTAYIGLGTAATATTYTELSYTGYNTRPSVTAVLATAGTPATPVPASTSNSVGAIAFGPISANAPANISNYFLIDTNTPNTGNLLGYQTISSGTPTVGETPTIATSSLTLTLQ